jgi:hypothetical protein
MEEKDDKDDKLSQLLHDDDLKVERLLERLDDVKRLEEIIHDYRQKKARSLQIALALVKFLKEGG